MLIFSRHDFTARPGRAMPGIADCLMRTRHAAKRRRPSTSAAPRPPRAPLARRRRGNGHYDARVMLGLELFLSLGKIGERFPLIVGPSDILARGKPVLRRAEITI